MNDVAPNLDIAETLGPEVERENWEFCWNRLVEVSRTFSRPIEMLPGRLRVATTTGYLLCRIADTVEDHPDLSHEVRDGLYQSFLDVMEKGATAEVFSRRFAEIPGKGPEHVLAEQLERVIDVFEQLPETMQATCRRWVVEMTRGMQLYSHRPEAEDDNGNEAVVLENLPDLERYCYFVAGTVGHLLTGLFVEQMESDGNLTAERRTRMRDVAESFGLGLQLVNVIKDQTDDLQRGWSFIPRTLAERHGLAHRELYLEENRRLAHRALEPVFERARAHLDDALEYTLAIPPDYRNIRLFCLLPLWMAVRTLVHAEGNDAMFIPDEPVKISRPEVELLIGDAVQNVQDDAALRTRYAELWERD